VERKTTLLLTKASLPEVIKKLRPQCSRPLNLYGHPKIHKESAPLKPIGAPTYRLAQYLAKQLGEYVGNSPRHVKNSMEFIIIQSLRACPENILVSFDNVSLFTMVPIVEALHLLSWHYDKDITRHFHHVLISSSFRFNGQFYEQTNGVAMSSPQIPVIADFFMEHFGKRLWMGRPTSRSAAFAT
jgi:hypothetical protein